MLGGAHVDTPATAHIDGGHIDNDTVWHTDSCTHWDTATPHVDEDWGAHVDESVSSPVLKVPLLEITPSAHFDISAPTLSVHADMSGHIDLHETLPIPGFTGELAVDGEVGFNGVVNLDTIDLHAEWDVTAHAGGLVDTGIFDNIHADATAKFNGEV